jgi:predicted transcriptional regulator
MFRIFNNCTVIFSKGKTLKKSKRFFSIIKNMTHYKEDWSYVKIHHDYPDKG